MRLKSLSLVAALVGSVSLSGCGGQESTATADGPAEPLGAFGEASTGNYEMDPTHASLSFSVTHLGVSNYIGRFTQYSMVLAYDADDLAASSLQVEIDPQSVDTDYTADYQATHPDREFMTWEEELATSKNFLNAKAHPSITYRSTSIERTGSESARIEGELSFLGQTHPVTLEAKLVGSAASHPFRPDHSVIGFSARGSFLRSAFGMNYLLTPPLVGDEVSLHFEGEFVQVIPPAAG